MAATTSPYALVVSDVDGTLVTKDKRLTEAAIVAVDRLRAAGIRFAITSSRPPRGLAKLLPSLRLETPIGGFNGGLFVTPDLEPIEARTLAPEDAQRAIAYLTAKGVDVWVFDGSDWLLTNLAGAYVEHEEFTLGYGPTVVADFSSRLGNVTKLVGSSKDFELLATCEAELKAMLGMATVARSQHYYLDTTHRDANKGTVVRTLAAKYGVEKAAILALGDMRNDLPMFAAAGFAVAMGQATDDVKAAASAVTDTNEQDGFAKAIARYVFGDGA